jgi:hypothetical protein
VHVENKSDPQHMNWLREAGRWERTKWIANPTSEVTTVEGQLGLVETSQTGSLHTAHVREVSERAWESVYIGSFLTVTVRHELDANDDLVESYAFKNTSAVALDFPLGSVAITAPIFDQYPSAKQSLSARCDVHVWMGGNSAWINAMRMGTEPPHLGMVVTQGSLDAYNQRSGTISDRGVFLLHPAAMKIKGGESKTIAWKLF